MGDFVDHVKGRDPENLFGGATTEQPLTLVRMTKKGVNENICVQEKASTGWKIFDPLHRHDYKSSISTS